MQTGSCAKSDGQGHRPVKGSGQHLGHGHWPGRRSLKKGGRLLARFLVALGRYLQGETQLIGLTQRHPIAIGHCAGSNGEKIGIGTQTAAMKLPAYPLGKLVLVLDAPISDGGLKTLAIGEPTYGKCRREPGEKPDQRRLLIHDDGARARAPGPNRPHAAARTGR